MRIGFLTDATVHRLDWAQQHGFGSIQWNRFDISGAGPGQQGWRGFAENWAGAARSRKIRISAIGAHSRNPVDAAQSEFARAAFLRAIEVAAHTGVKTVAGFPGAVIELEPHPRGNNPMYKPFEQFLPRLIQFWEPIAKVAA